MKRPTAGKATVKKQAATPAPSRRNAIIASVAVAALVLGVGAWFVLHDRAPEGVVRLVSPRPEGALATPTFVWRSNKTVSGYEMEIVTEGGDQVFFAGTSDTTLSVPVDRFEIGRKYLWLVRGLVNGEAKSLSHIDRFTYQP